MSSGVFLACRIVQNPLLLSDSCLHLFLQSQLSVAKMQACAAGKTHYTVAQAVHSCGLRRFHSEEDLQKDVNTSCDSDSDRWVQIWRVSIAPHPKNYNFQTLLRVGKVQSLTAEGMLGQKCACRKYASNKNVTTSQYCCLAHMLLLLLF